MNAWMIAGLVVVVIVAWGGFWVALISMIGRLGGWRRLATAYPLPERSPDSDAVHPLGIAAAQSETKIAGQRTFALQSLVLGRFVNYNRAVHFTITEQGLVLRVVMVFKFGHSPILLPWNEFTAEPAKRLGFRMMRLQTRREPGVSITIPIRLADQLAEAAGQHWPSRVS